MKATALIVLISFALVMGHACSSASDKLSWRVEYDDDGRVARRIDPSGRSTLFAYEHDPGGALLRVIKTPPEGKPVIVQFGDRGRHMTMSDDGGSVDYLYDDFGRLKEVFRKGGPAVSYEYDTQDRVSRLQVGELYRVDYTYDFLGRLEAVKMPSGTILFEYGTGQGRIVRTLPNGIKTIWEYEPNGQLRRIVHVDKESMILAEYTYQYRPDGLIESIRDRSSRGNVTTTYQYDLTGRLVMAKMSSGEEYRYEYDSLGNRTIAAQAGSPPRLCEADPVGRLTSTNGKPCAHDASGNLSALPSGGKEERFTYTSDGLLKTARDGTVSYRYDGNGRLIARKAGNIEATFIPDPLSPYWQPLVMETTCGKRALTVWDGSVPLVMIRDGKPEYLLHDHLGSVRLVLDSQGKVAQRIDYDPFGKPADPAAQSDFVPRFAGLFWEPKAQAYLTLARAYAPDMGRFLQPDPEKRVPYGSQKDLSLYAYCGGDPVNFVDRNGEAPEIFRDISSYFDTLRTDLWNGMEGFSKNTWDSFVSFHKDWWLNPSFSERPQEYYDAERRSWLVNALNEYQRECIARHPEFRGTSWDQLTWDQRRSVRKEAVDRFFKDHSSYLNKEPTDKVGFHTYILNSNVRTPLGWTSLDWLTTLGDSGNDPKIDEWTGHDIMRRYYTGKAYWNISAPASGRKEMPEWGNLYPERDLNAAQILRTFVYNPRYRFEEIFLDSPSKSTSGYPGSIPPTIELKKPKPVYQSDRVLPPSYPSYPPPGSGFDWNVIGNDNDPWRPRGGAAVGSPARPSPVGGVYLGGAAKTLEGIGLLNGIALDSNKNLILLAKGEERLPLPSLRLDDVVTVFRSVYLGEGPSVTIDPSSRNPEESAMIIRHGRATEDTFVGWVLYEADRLMKGYTLGVDNKTGKDIVCGVPNYREVLETIYFGSGDPERSRKEGHWERFWIVPAAARRFEGPRHELTLMDVPLKVKTQSMKWEDGKLVDDLQGRSSAGAMAFTDWFSTRYDLIAEEQFLLPPKESSIATPVPVFAELRRIALMTAIAEKLRDQGVPMPFWMREYDVQTVPFEKTTPALRVTRSNERVRARIFGGVQLSPASQDVKVFNAASDLQELPPAEKKAAEESVKLVGELEDSKRSLPPCG